MSKPKYRLDLVVSKDEMRESIQSILIEDGKAIATNGKIMAVVPFESDLGRCTISKAGWKKILDGKDIAEEDVGGAAIFPKWKSVVPEHKEGNYVRVGLNAKQLYDLVLALGQGKEDSYSIVLEIPLVFNLRTPIKVIPIKVIQEGKDGTEFGLILPIAFREDYI